MTLAEKVRPEHTALVVIDMQNDFCHPEGAWGKLGMPLEATHRMIPRLESLLQHARGVGVQVVFVGTHYLPEVLTPVWTERREHRRRVPMLRPGTWGAQFILPPQPQDIVLYKHRYSAFLGTPLDLVLRGRGIQTVVLAGTVTNVCVETTARDACQREYYVVVVEDCCSALSEEDHQAALRNVDRYFGEVVSSDVLRRAWSAVATVGSSVAYPGG
ncbi:MAG: isochorismatase family cysteine hydrolase [Armatimonadota bacterium]|nr:isochorismatase family cysteine hydrolase [Armatimonadota bacterium]MDR7439366.1 isochorismatase family cysteine hydrolase [Armatimonadota bacterium]MDR7563205.1 isochorismatase family cysteine hydrolase [Armatimonadota bacterium]MDR7568749.1 isochorismatase family cysteine hydrolase [Armatimonadota bacterium]MDR7601891.1 isochorismatase family cysteine hydrolase [Armatimonadota bacterium]